MADSISDYDRIELLSGAGFHVPKGRIDAALGFSVMVGDDAEIADPNKKLKGWPP